MMFRIEQRTEPSASMRVGAPLIAILLTLITSSIMFGLLGHNPFVTLYAFFIEPLTSINGISEWLLKASPLILIGCGLAIGFRANVWNIGAEGQLIMGAIAAGGVGLFYPDPESLLLLPMMIVAGMLGGMAWAAIPAFLRARMSTNEILVTLMLTYVATLFLSLLVHGPWRDPDGFNYPQTALLPNAAMFEPFDYAYRLNTSIVITVIAVIAMWIFTERSFFGYKMSVGGAAPLAARYAGFKESGSIWIGLLISGGAAGIAGMMEVAGPLGQLSAEISPGYGFAAIIVAFIGRLHAIGIVLGGLFLSLLYLGGESVQLTLGLPAAVALIFQGILLFFLLASDFLIFYRIRRVERHVARSAA
ncbi:MAG: ABC transporter permease [Geminicoccaceae bacterium]